MRLNRHSNRIFGYLFVSIYKCMCLVYCTGIDKVEKFHGSTFSQRKEKKNRKQKKKIYTYNVLLNKHRNSNSEFGFIYHRELSVWQRWW